MERRDTKRVVAWERLRRHFMVGTHVGLAVLLAVLVVVLLNVLAWRIPHTWTLDVRARHMLSEKTRDMLAGLEGRVDVIALFDPDNGLYDDVRGLLLEYQHAAQSIGGLQVQIEWVNPNRDIARTRQLASKYDLDAGNQVVFVSGENSSVVDAGDLSRYEYELTESGIARRMVGFFGEQAFSSTMLSVVSSKAPVVYFLTGHGERDINDFSPDRGYSTLARVISRDHYDVRRLSLPRHSGVPADCDVLVIAGPTQKLADEEIRWISDYLSQRRGRVLLLLDTTHDGGLGSLLEQWQIFAGPGYVTGMRIPGWGLVVTEYGDHPITRPLRNVNTAFAAPRPLLPLRANGFRGGVQGDSAEDQVRLTVLAGTGPEGWVEMDTEQHPPVLDEGVDLKGPVPIALAAELGPISPDAQLTATRLVVIGDSHFVSNAGISGGVGGNVSFFMLALNWLADRDALLSIEPTLPTVLQPALTTGQWRKVSLLVIFVLPGVLGLFGVLVGYQRKR
ncbi:MAG: GldG family protein [Kiritimatiellia bacterium]